MPAGRGQVPASEDLGRSSVAMTMSQGHQWRERREYPLTTDSLSDLLANKIPAIRVKNFANADECARFAIAMRSGARKEYGVDRPIGYIGMAQYEFRWSRSKKDYFDAVPKAFADQRFVFDRSFDVMARFISVLGSAWPSPVRIAEDEYGPYFAGIIRFATNGIGLHADYAPFNMPGYSVDQITSQLAWNLFVEAPASGGVTTLCNAPWTPEMEPGKPPQSYGLSKPADGAIETFQYAPAVGDVVIFNSRNPHEVSAGLSEAGHGRLQIGSFAGHMPDRSLVLFA